MALSGTEAEIINYVARLRAATKHQIRSQIGFSVEYIGFLCRYLVGKGYLIFFNGCYSLDNTGIKSLLTEEPRIDKSLIKEVAEEVARKISGELIKTVKTIKMPVSVRETKGEAAKEPKEQMQIKTDFELPVEDESLSLETNIDKIGIKLEKEKSDIKNKVELLQRLKLKKGGKYE